MIDVHPNVSNYLTDSFSLIQNYFVQPIEFTLSVHHKVNFVTYTAVQSSAYKKLHWVDEKSDDAEHDGYLLSPVYFSKVKIPRNVFHCTDGSYIDETLVCDGSKDCTEGTDKQNCTCTKSLESSFSVCKYNFNSNFEKFMCSDFFYQCSSLPICIPYVLVCNGQKECQHGEHEICGDNTIKIEDETQHNEMFICLISGISIPVSLVDDLIPDCPGTFEDEVQYYNLLTTQYFSKNLCNSSSEIPCIPGHGHCFPLNKLCIYELQHNSSQLKYCRNGAHLYNCTNFQCPGYFKCSLSYCVPFDLVCNSNWDCPEGHDEKNCLSHSCSNLFKCKNQNKCLHLSKICDNSEDCIYGDDELSCASSYSFTCPSNCICFAQSVVCYHLSQIKQKIMWSFTKYLKCYSCTMNFNNIHSSLPLEIKFLNIKYHLSTNICVNKNKNSLMFSSLRILDMTFNNMTIVKSCCLVSLYNLKILYLQQNRIECMQNKAFSTLINLKILDLSHNKITKLTKGMFGGLNNVAVLNLTANLITSVDDTTFNSVHHMTVHSLNRQVCCMSGSWLK